jgi:hypothetical protein
MSPISQIGGGKISTPNTIYTAVLAVAFAVVLATAAYVAFKCFAQYGTIFSMP